MNFVASGRVICSKACSIADKIFFFLGGGGGGGGGGLCFTDTSCYFNKGFNNSCVPDLLHSVIN